MKIKIAFIFFLSFCQLSFSQIEEWNIYDFDSIVSIEMPYDVYETDTIIKYKKIYEIYSENDSIEFSVRKVYLGKLYSNIEVTPLPKDNKSLEKYYLNLIEVLAELVEAYDYKVDSYQPIFKFGLKGYKLIFRDDDQILIQELELFLVNKNFYSFSYTNVNGLNIDDKRQFFNSIIFDKQQELKQIYGSKIPYKTFVFVLLFILFLSFFIKSKPRRRRDLN